MPFLLSRGWSESSGQSITIEFDQSISSDNGNDLFSLIYNNSLNVYIDGEQLTSTDISNIYFGNPSYDASGGMTDDASGYFTRLDAADQLRPTAASMYHPDTSAVPVTTHHVPMHSIPSCFTIEFNDGSYLKEGQTVFVSYDGGGGLVDSNENSINPFSQIVNNSSTVYNDETAPTISPDEFNKPSINADGQTISLNFSEDIDQVSVENSLNNFKLFVDGVENRFFLTRIMPRRHGCLDVRPIDGLPATDLLLVLHSSNGTTMSKGKTS